MAYEVTGVDQATLEALLIEEALEKAALEALVKEEREAAEALNLVKNRKDVAASRVAKLHSRIGKAKSHRVKVTDHAVVRYLERVRGMDIEAIVDEMVPADCVDKIIGASGLIDAGTHELRIQNGVVTTAVAKGELRYDV